MEMEMLLLLAEEMSKKTSAGLGGLIIPKKKPCVKCFCSLEPHVSPKR